MLHDWCNKDCGMCYLVCGSVHIKDHLLLIGKSSPCEGSGFALSLSEWFFTICLTPHNSKSLNKKNVLPSHQHDTRLITRFTAGRAVLTAVATSDTGYAHIS